MYAYKQQASMFPGIATLVTIALVLWAVGTHMFTPSAEAANLTNLSDLLTDSGPSKPSVHTFTFSVPNGIQANQVFAVTFPAGFDISNVTLSDISLTVGGDATTTLATNGVDQWGVASGTQHFEFTAPSDDVIASSTQIILVIGNEAGNMITNPAATTTYEIDIGTDTATTTIPDAGQTRVAIIDEVLVTANVNTLLNFTVNGTTTGAVCNGAPAAFATSTNVALAFGTLNAGVAKTLCQQLSVSTNAVNGYTVTVEQTQQLQSSTGADIDGFVDGNWTTTPTTWASPTANISNDDTWGHWGLTSSDATTTRTLEFGSGEFVAASTTPIVIMGHASSSDGTTLGVGLADIAYQVEISALQEAGDDYNTTLIYIATPTF